MGVLYSWCNGGAIYIVTHFHFIDLVKMPEKYALHQCANLLTCINTFILMLCFQSNF